MKAVARNENISASTKKSKLPVPTTSKASAKKPHVRKAPNFERLHQKWKDQFEMGKACTKKANTVPQEFDVTKSGTKFKRANVRTTNYDSDGESIPDIDFEGDQRALEEILNSRAMSERKITGRATIETSSARRMSRSKSCSSVPKSKRKILGELPCDPDQKPKSRRRRSQSAKKALEFSCDKKDHYEADIDFEKDDTALESILSGIGVQSHITHSSTIRQTFAGTDSQKKESAVTPVRNSIYYAPTRNDRMSIIDKWTAYKNRHDLVEIDKDSTKKAQITTILESKELDSGHSKFALPVGHPLEVSSCKKAVPCVMESPFGKCVSQPMRNSIYSSHLSYPSPQVTTNLPATPKSEGQKMINKDKTNSARRVLCSSYMSPAPQRQEMVNDNTSSKKQKRGVKWADLLSSPSVDSPKRVIKKEKLSKTLFTAIDENDGDDYKENQHPIGNDRHPSLATRQESRRNQIADNRESFRKEKVFYNNDVTIYNDNKANKADESSHEKSANDIHGTSRSISCTPISNTTAFSMSHASIDADAAVVETLDPSSINVPYHKVLDSEIANCAFKQSRETLVQQPTKDNGQKLINYGDNDSNLNSKSNLYFDSNNKLCSVTDSQIYMGNGKFRTSLQNSVATTTKNQEKQWHHGTGISSASTLWNRPNIVPSDRFQSNCNDRVQPHFDQNHAGAKTWVSSSGGVTHAYRNYYTEDVESVKTDEVLEIHQRGVVIHYSKMAMHTEEAEEEHQENSGKSKSENGSKQRTEAVDKFVGRVKRNKKRQSITELNETLGESQVHFQNLQSEISNLMDTQRLESVSEEIDNNGNENVTACETSSRLKSQNGNIIYQLQVIKKQQEQLMLLQRQLQEQLEYEMEHGETISEIKETHGEKRSLTSENIQQNFPKNSDKKESLLMQKGTGSLLVQQGLVGKIVQSEIESEIANKTLNVNLDLEECNNNGATAINLNTMQGSDQSKHTILALDLSNSPIVGGKTEQHDSRCRIDRSASTPPSTKCVSASLHHKVDDLTATSLSRSHSIQTLVASTVTTPSHTLTQSHNGTPPKLNRTVSPAFKLQAFHQSQSAMSPLTTVQSNLSSVVTPKAVKFEPTATPKCVADTSSSVPPIWTPLALRTTSASQVSNPVVLSGQGQTVVDPSQQGHNPVDLSQQGQELSAQTSSSDNVVLNLSGSVTVTNVINSGTNICMSGDLPNFSSPVHSSQSAFRSPRPNLSNLNQSAFRTIAGMDLSSQSGSLSLRANVEPVDLSPRRQNGKQSSMRKIVLLVTSERYQEALLDDECALYACRLHSMSTFPESYRLTNPVARMLTEGDDMHFIPIKEDPVHHYGFREGSAFSCYSP